MIFPTQFSRLGCPVVQLQKSTFICHSGWWLRHPSLLVMAILVKWEHPQYECVTIIMCRAWVYVPYHMEFSENGDTPKLSWIRPFQYWNPWWLGDPPFWETAIRAQEALASVKGCDKSKGLVSLTPQLICAGWRDHVCGCLCISCFPQCRVRPQRCYMFEGVWGKSCRPMAAPWPPHGLVKNSFAICCFSCLANCV